MPLSELEKEWTGMNFDVAAEEMRRLKKEPTDEEKLLLYGLYKQSLHGNIPTEDFYEIPTKDDVAIRKYNAWAARKECELIKVSPRYRDKDMKCKYGVAWRRVITAVCSGQHPDAAKEEYVRVAEKMIQKYHRRIVRCKWNSEVWSVDY